MELEVYRQDGSKSGEKVKLSESIFGIEPNQHALYLAVRAYLDNQRQGTSKVKTRAEVRGGGRKPFKQKHTGMARQGSSRSPVMVGGGRSSGRSRGIFRWRFRRKCVVWRGSRLCR